jgi:hypothetical protein
MPDEVPKDVPEFDVGQSFPPPAIEPPPSYAWNAAPPMAPPGYGRDPLQALIPTQNPKALAAYYFGVFSFACALLGPVALILGISGLKEVNRLPGLPGKGHSWAGIIMGSITTILLLVVVVIVFIAFAGRHAR